jgi:hypothetical protein
MIWSRPHLVVCSGFLLLSFSYFGNFGPLSYRCIGDDATNMTGIFFV